MIVLMLLRNSKRMYDSEETYVETSPDAAKVPRLA